MFTTTARKTINAIHEANKDRYTYTTTAYRNGNGVETVLVQPIFDEATNNCGYYAEVIILHTGEIIACPSYEVAEDVAQALNSFSLATLLPVYEVYTCAEDPTKPRVKDGVFMNGEWAGFTAAQEDGVWGAYLFERFSPWR